MSSTPEQFEERVLRVLDDLMAAWVNAWLPGENQDLIDEADDLRAEIRDGLR